MSVEGIFHFAFSHQIAVTFTLCWLLSCFSESMPKPTPTSSPFYVWIFSFLHLVAGAIPRLIALTFPTKYAAMFNTTLQPSDSSDPPAKPSAPAQ